jgi:hypothetical protein
MLSRERSLTARRKLLVDDCRAPLHESADEKLSVRPVALPTASSPDNAILRDKSQRKLHSIYFKHSPSGAGRVKIVF